MSSRTDHGIAYDDLGAGDPTLLFMPGWCSNRDVFAPLLDHAARHRRVLAVDWRGHGDSAPPSGHLGFAELVDDAVSVVEASGAARVVPVGLSHAGWVAIELRRRLGSVRVPALVFLDWMVLGPPPPFLDALAAMRDPARTRFAVDGIIEMWAAHSDNPALLAHLDSMAKQPDEMWATAATAIAGGFAEHGAPVDAVSRLEPVPPVLHLYAQPPDPGFLAAQEEFAAAHAWFAVHRLDAHTHFPMFELPEALTGQIERFVASRT